jgi:hypothetical protein
LGNLSSFGSVGGGKSGITSTTLLNGTRLHNWKTLKTAQDGKFSWID